MYDSVVSSLFIELGSHHHYLMSKHSPSPPPPVPICSDSLVLFLSSPATTNLHSVFVDLPTLEISYKWNHINMAFCIWLLSLSIMFSRSIHVVTSICTGGPWLMMVPPMIFSTLWWCKSDTRSVETVFWFLNVDLFLG